MLKIYESIQNLDYLLCPKLSHEHSPLNLICADCNCTNCSLICIYCEQQGHEDHDTMPFKDYLKKVSISSKLQLEAESTLRWANDIQKSKNQCVAFLQDFKQKLNDKIDQLIHQVNVQFQITSDKIKDIMTINDQLDNLLFSYRNLTNLASNPQQMKMSQQSKSSFKNKQANKTAYDAKLNKINTKIKHLMRHTAVESSNVNEEAAEQGICSKEYQLACLNTQLKSTSLLYSDKCRGVIKIVQKTSLQFQQGMNKAILQQQQKISSIIRSRSKKFTWSQSIKANAIIIKDTIAERGSGSNIQRFALFSQPLIPNVYSKQKITWALRVVKLVGWIGIGVCLRNKIVANNYKFTYESLGHGSYMLSSNGYTWSSSVQSMNSAYHSFSFSTGDFVILQFDGHPKWTLTTYICKQDTLLTKSKEGTKSAPTVSIFPKVIPKLKLANETQPICVSLSQLTKIQTLQLDESSDYYPCVNLSSVGDSVQIAS